MDGPEVPHPTETACPERAGRVARFRTGVARTLVRCVDRVRSWHQRRRDQRLLARLDDRSLRDIGIDRATVESDSTASFWRSR